MIGALFIIAYAAGAWMILEEYIKETLWHAKVRKTLDEAGKKIKVVFAWRRSSSSDDELYKSCVLLKNLVIVTKDVKLSTEHIFERLMENSGSLRPVYGRLISLYRSGRDEEAFKVLAETVGTREARTFGLILSKLDKMDPEELREQMDIFQRDITEKKVTAAMKQAQRNSMVITAMSALSVFALLINFTVVVIFMKSIDMMGSVFL